MREIDFWNAFNEGLYGVRFFEQSSYQQSPVFMNLENFWLKFRYNPSKLLEELIFFSHSHHHHTVSYSKNRDMRKCGLSKSLRKQK